LRAGTLLKEVGDVDAAIRQYTEAGAFNCIADLIEEVESEYLRASRGLLLARWLELLPTTVYRQRPHLQLLQAELYRQTGRSSQALKLVRRLERRLAEPEVALTGQPRGAAGTPTGAAQVHYLAAHAMVINAEVQHYLGRYKESQRSSATALDRLAAAQEAGAEEAALEGLYARAYENLAGSVLLTDGPEAAEPHLRACERHSLYSGDLWKVGRHHYQRSKILMQEGNFVRAESAAVAALLAAEEAHDEICSVASRLNLGAIKMRRGRVAEAREELATALDEARAVGYTLGEVYALSNLADLALNSGAFLDAITLYEQTFQVLGSAEDTHLRLCASVGLGYALTLAGRPEEAIVRLTPLVGAFQVGSKKGAERRTTADDVFVALSLGFAYLRHGLTSCAAELFARAAHEATLHGQMLKSAQAHLFLGAIQANECKQPGAEAEILLALDNALSTHDGLALAVELRRVPEVWPLLERLDHPLANDLMRAVRVGSLLSSSASVHPSEGALLSPGEGDAGSRPVENIRVYMFGAARILVGTSYITRWKKPAARDLLLFLLHHRRPASRETILSALWPDADPEVSDVWFRQARYHLQHTLARDCLVQEETGFWRLELDCWIDVRETERLVEEGMRLIAAGEKAAGAGCLRQALTLWHGPYLDDLYVDWTAERRNELYQWRLSILEHLAGLELEAASADKAAQLYQQILATEPFYESAHRGLMHCFVARGEPSRAIQHFRAYSNLLRDGLNTTPAAETLALCASILSEMHTTSHVFAEAMSRVSSSV
jgi:DNA-binding SARP family transcriptional activator